jgi:hypothetical protein
LRGRSVHAEELEEERLAEVLASLHERGMDRLRRCLDVLDREQRALRSGSAAEIAALADAEGSSAREAASVAAAIDGFERTGRLGTAVADRPAIQALRREHAALRIRVLERNRAVRSALVAEMARISRDLAGRRARTGAPSPFASIGDAALVDIRT